MATDTVEQEKVAVEQVSEVSEGEPKEPVSKSTETVSESADTDKVDWRKRFEQSEAERRAFQSAMDKRMKQQEADATKRRQAEREAEEDRKLAAEYDSFIAEGEDEKKVLSLREKAEAVKKKERELNLLVAQHNEDEKGFTDTRNTVLATEAILKRLSPEHEALLKEAVPRLVKLSKGDPEVMEELAEIVLAKYKTTEAEEPAQEKPKAPYTGRSAPVRGSGTFTREQIRAMSPEEYVKKKDAIDEAERRGLIK